MAKGYLIARQILAPDTAIVTEGDFILVSGAA